MNHILDVIEWNKYIYNKKLFLLNNIDNNNTIDSSNDSLKFNDILKDIIKINIFNISYISFMIFKFLEKSFIPSAILLNAIDIYTDEQMFNILYLNNYEECKIDKINKIKYIPESLSYIKSLKFIINMIIEFVVTIELLLNIQCLLITDFIDKIYYNKSNKSNTNNNDYNDNSFKPNIFKIFNKTNKATINHIKPSTRILLILKLISKLGSNDYSNYNNNIILLFSNKLNVSNEINSNEINPKQINPKLINYMKNKKEINNKKKIYLDTFIIEISKYFGSDKIKNEKEETHEETHEEKHKEKHKEMHEETHKEPQEENNKKIDITTNYEIIAMQDIYLICSKYMINNIELIFNNFENIFSILEEQLLKSANINDIKTKTLFTLKNVIKKLIDNEIVKIKKLFYI